MDFSFLQQIIDRYFTAPLASPSDTAPYNWVNTLTYALLALVAAYLIYKLLERLEVKIDARFFYSILPFVLLGGAVRAAVDTQVLPRQVNLFGTVVYPFVTPLVYFVVFFVCIACLAVALAFRSRLHLIMAASGSVLFVAVLLSYAPLLKNFSAIGAIIGLALLGLAISEALSLLAARLWGPTRRGLPDRIAVFAHAFDGAATFVGVTALGYSEQHVVANILFSIGSPLLFFAVKVLFATIAVEVFSREIAQKQDGQRYYLLLLLTIFGLAPGLRDTLRIAAGA